MTKDLPNVSRASGPKATGTIFGLAFGVAVSTLLFFRFGGLYLYLSFFGSVPVLIGAFVGVFLAWMGAVPYVRPVPTIILAATIAIAPIVAGVVEMRQRELPFPIPPDFQVIEWTKYPWGESVVIVESADEVQAFFDRLVASAQESWGWCNRCFYQSLTNSGHASFGTKDARAGQSPGYMGIEVWSGEKEFYGTAPSELQLARIFHRLRTRSPAIVVYVISSLMLLTVVLQMLRKMLR